jgi:hypothetical protein
MNCLAAIAENLNTFYFYRLEDDKRNMGYDYDRLASLIVNTAIQFDECDCVVRSKLGETRLKFQCQWPGKSASDWQNDIISLI